MNDTLEYLGKKFLLDLNKRPPVEIEEADRHVMAEVLQELGYRIGAEIGVARGQHAEILCKANPDLKLHCVDIWGVYPGYSEYVDRINRYYRDAQKRLAPYNCELIKDFSMSAVEQFDDGSLDFVYIDAAHDFKNVAMDICEWSKKVRVGGIVYGHDYMRRYHKYVVQVKDVVQAYFYSHAINPWFVLDKRRRSWMFVRQDTDRMRT